MILKAKQEVYESRLKLQQRSLENISEFLEKGLNLQ